MWGQPPRLSSGLGVSGRGLFAFDSPVVHPFAQFAKGWKFHTPILGILTSNPSRQRPPSSRATASRHPHSSECDSGL